MDNLASAWGLLGYGGMYGLGLRYQKVVVADGFLKNANFKDELAVEGGLDYARQSSGWQGSNWTINYFRPAVGAMWNFWFNDNLAVYPKLDLAYAFASVSWPSGFGNTSAYSYGGIQIEAAGGLMYRLPGLALRAELGSSFLKAGAGLSF